MLFDPRPPGAGRLTDGAGRSSIRRWGRSCSIARQARSIVEGHAQGRDEAERYLVSRTRAAVVRDYLVRRFELDPTATGFIALGGEPVGVAPSSAWEGIVLAVFVDPKQTGRQ